MNDKNRIRKEIAELIDNLKSHSDNISSSPSISSFEMELMLHKISKLYEKSVIFHYLCKSPDAVQTSQVTPESELSSKKESEKTAELKEQKIPAEIAPLIPEISKVQSPVTDLFGEKIPSKEKPKEEKKFFPVNKVPVADMKTAIGINDKFRFINELFHGNSQEYNIAINQINNCRSFDEADVYLNTLRGLYDWKDDSQAVNSFVGLVERRFL